MKVVFLHIPKTAGQSVTRGLISAFGSGNVSPIRAHSQATGSCFEDWMRYTVFAGHLDWYDLHAQAGPKFVFSILRDPKERIASFYFFLLKQAQTLSPKKLALPENRGKQAILSMSPDNYFMAGDASWRVFVRDHYNNFYCTYFARRKFRPGGAYFDLNNKERLRQARSGMAELDLICSTSNLERLETRLEDETGKKVIFARRRVNPGPLPTGQSRWAALCDRLESDKTTNLLKSFTILDEVLYNEVVSSG